MRVKYLSSLLLVAAILSGCTSSGLNKASLTETWQIEDLGPERDAYWSAEYFDEGLELFKAVDCKSRLNYRYSYDQDSKKKVPLWGEVDMLTYQAEIDFYPSRYLYRDYLDIPSDDDWGNIVDKVLIITSAYLGRLRIIHDEINRYPESYLWDVSFNYEPKEYNPYDNYITENGVLGDFEKYLERVSTVAKQLCYEGKSPSSEQAAIAESAYNVLLEDWASFNTWLENTRIFADEANRRIKIQLDSDNEYDDKPICDEYPTTLPGYVIVKCTNLP